MALPSASRMLFADIVVDYEGLRYVERFPLFGCLLLFSGVSILYMR